MWTKLFISFGAVSGLCGVILGAVSAHGLSHLEPSALADLKTASAYLLVHGLLLVIIALWTEIAPPTALLRLAGCLVMIGIIFFCGGLTIAELTANRSFAMAAPAGGLALLGGWLVLVFFGLTR